MSSFTQLIGPETVNYGLNIGDIVNVLDDNRKPILVGLSVNTIKPESYILMYELDFVKDDTGPKEGAVATNGVFHQTIGNISNKLLDGQHVQLKDSGERIILKNGIVRRQGKSGKYIFYYEINKNGKNLTMLNPKDRSGIKLVGGRKTLNKRKKNKKSRKARKIRTKYFFF